MIKWLREKFSSVVVFFFVISVIAISIAGAISGYIIGEETGAIIGLLLGVLIGFFLGILTFGFVATIINISETCDGLRLEIEEIRSLLYKVSGDFDKNIKE